MLINLSLLITYDVNGSQKCMSFSLLVYAEKLWVMGYRFAEKVTCKTPKSQHTEQNLGSYLLSISEQEIILNWPHSLRLVKFWSYF